MNKYLRALLISVAIATSQSAVGQTKVQGLPRADMRMASPTMTGPVSTTFGFDDITTWYGEGSKKAAFVIQWNDERETSAYIIGYRWDGEILGGDAWDAIAAADPRLILAGENSSQYGGSIRGIGWDVDGAGDFSIVKGRDELKADENGFIYLDSGDGYTATNGDDFWQSGWTQGYWSYWQASSFRSTWKYAQVGAYYETNILQDGALEAWNFAVGMNPQPFKPLANPPEFVPMDFDREPNVDGISYSLKSLREGTLSVRKYNSKTGGGDGNYCGEIVIPHEVIINFHDEAIKFTVDEIETEAFANSDITSIAIPATVKTIGTGCFLNCKSLERVDLESTDISVGQNLFSGCEKLSDVILFDNMDEVPFGQFNGTAIPDGVTSIGKTAFRNCTELEHVHFPETLEVIDQRAFMGCTKLESLEIPSSLSSMASYSFADCNNIRQIVSNATIPPKAVASTFSTATYQSAQLHVPIGSEEAYRSAPGWSNFVSINAGFSGIDDIIYPGNGGSKVDVYNMQGMLILKQVTWSEAMSKLPHGLYIVGNKKIYI